MIKVKELARRLKQLGQEQYIKVANDEEWNTIFTDFLINKDGKHGSYIIYGLSGSEEESYQDIADNKFNRKID